jgi:hypothetical protein
LGLVANEQGDCLCVGKGENEQCRLIPIAQAILIARLIFLMALLVIK